MGLARVGLGCFILKTWLCFRCILCTVRIPSIVHDTKSISRTAACSSSCRHLTVSLALPFEKQIQAVTHFENESLIIGHCARVSQPLIKRDCVFLPLSTTPYSQWWGASLAPLGLPHQQSGPPSGVVPRIQSATLTEYITRNTTNLQLFGNHTADARVGSSHISSIYQNRAALISPSDVWMILYVNWPSLHFSWCLVPESSHFIPHLITYHSYHALRPFKRRRVGMSLTFVKSRHSTFNQEASRFLDYSSRY